MPHSAAHYCAGHSNRVPHRNRHQGAGNGYLTCTVAERLEPCAGEQPCRVAQPDSRL
jgi:hypothetical protein